MRETFLALSVAPELWVLFPPEVGACGRWAKPLACLLGKSFLELVVFVFGQDLIFAQNSWLGLWCPAQPLRQWNCVWGVCCVHVTEIKQWGNENNKNSPFWQAAGLDKIETGCGQLY